MGFGLTERKPRMCSDEQGGMLGMSKLGWYESIPNDSDPLRKFGIFYSDPTGFFSQI